MSLIILGLLVMFNQTQRAFVGSMPQVDVMEAGRHFMAMIGREIEQLTPSQSRWTTNFFAELSPTFHSTGVMPMRQALPGTAAIPTLRTNVVQRFFFLSKVNQDWYGTGYLVIPDRPNAGVGTLYRFSTNRTLYNSASWSRDFLNSPLTNLNRIADGVVHLRAMAYDVNGALITPLRPQTLRNTSRTWDIVMPDQMDCYFTNNATPAYVELELGILEPRTLERWRSLLDPIPQQRFLSNHIAEVHLFRQRFSLRNVDA